MASPIEAYTLGWNDYANNFSISLKNLLEQKELTDVTLVADGHLFNAHRLVLSALSPYFRQMFTQMPVNQQAFVFLKDVPKETFENLMTFIYCGNVNVEKEHLEEFLSTAKALDIKGLADGGYANSSDVQLPIFKSLAPSYNNLQYQSTRTIPMQSNRDVQSRHYESPVNAMYQEQENFGNEHTNVKIRNGYDEEDYFCSDLGNGDSMAMGHDDQWNDDSADGAELKLAKPISNAKRTKTNIDTFEYNTVADIRTNNKGQENLFIAGQKFVRQYSPNRNGQARWACTRKTAINKCRASAKTMEVNGVVMMKILVAEHSMH